MATDPQFFKGVLAEFVVLNTALGQVLSRLARESGEPDQYCKALLEEGLAAVAAQSLWGAPPEVLDQVRMEAEARYSDLISNAAKNAKK